jgi:hypothetical protein
LLGSINKKDTNTLPQNIIEFPRSVSQCKSTWRQLGQLEKEYDGAIASLAKFKVNPEYLRYAHLPKVLVSSKRGAPTLAQLVARPSNVPLTEMMMLTTMMPPPIKRQKQHINPETNRGYNSPFLPWLSGPKRQPRIPKTAAQLRLAPKDDSADRSPSRKPEIALGSTAESPILVNETESDKKRSSPSFTSSDQTTSSGTDSGKTPGTGSRYNHGETRKELVPEDIPSEAKEEAEKRRRDAAMETRDRKDRDNLKSKSGSSRNEKKDKKTNKKSSRSVSRSNN